MREFTFKARCCGSQISPFHGTLVLEHQSLDLQVYKDWGCSLLARTLESPRRIGVGMYGLALCKRKLGLVLACRAKSSRHGFAVSCLEW